MRRSLESGIDKILFECLSLKAGELLALFADETTASCAKIIASQARNSGVEVRVREIKLKEQREFQNDSGRALSLPDYDAISNSRAVLTCLSNQPDCTMFRIKLVTTSTDRGRRVGHMPGITEEILTTAFDIDYEKSSRECQSLALSLLIGKKAKLITYAPNGTEPERFGVLEFDLGGFKRPSITSTGLIPRNTWGNLPAGEAFIAPMEGTGKGTFYLTGSFRGTVLQPPGFLKLNFADGEIKEIQGEGKWQVRFKQLLETGRQDGDATYKMLAEFGIGVNPRIRELVGNPLLDEKCAGTAHIAIGANRGYGGKIDSSIHEDLITRSPSLWIDGKEVLNRGRIVYSEDDWHPSIDSIKPNPKLCSSRSTVSRTNITTERHTDGLLRVRREVAAGRHCVYVIGRKHESVWLREVFQQIPAFPIEVSVIKLQERLSAVTKDPDFIHRVLTLLAKHMVIRINSSRSKS